MRAQDPDDGGLEALAVLVDGVERPPVPASRHDPAGSRALAELDRALRTTRADASPFGATPWRTAAAPPGEPGTRAVAAFSRMIGLEPPRLRTLAEWWRRQAAGGGVRVGRVLVLEEPRSLPGGGWRIGGRLRVPGRARPVPVELLLWPRLDRWTRLHVEPQRGVRAGRRYFARGQRALDALCRRLDAELERPPEGRGGG
jgi:hypothetical protein